jgi:hypothetical protein
MADQWWKIELGPNESAASIQDQFQDVFAITGIPRGAALFGGPASVGGQVVYFSPTAAILASFLLEANGGKPCDRPAEGIFLVGHDKDRELLPAPTRR